MKTSKREALKRAGWRIGDAADFLGLSAEEASFVELKLALADCLRRMRTERGLTQRQAAVLLASSQSRVAKMEAADATVSVDLLIRSLLNLGASRELVGRVIAEAA